MVKYIENYALYESIGSGVYGKVYRAINDNDKKEYAVKVIPIAKFKQNKKLEQCTVNEINILTNIQFNQHIIRYFDMLKTSNNFYFIYEYCNGGTLEGLLTKQGKLSEESALLIFKQLLQAFQVLNKYNIMHRDLKPDNIFFHNGVIKLGDFGFCKNLNSADEMAKTMLGSPIYMAPEILKGQIYSNKADIWSLGVVLYEMLFGHCPFQSNSIAKLIEVLNTRQLEFPDKISNFLKDLIQRMLTKDSSKRLGWMELLQIKISSEGSIQTQKVKAISSLSQAKSSNQLGLLMSTKYTPQDLTTSVKQSAQQPITGKSVHNSNAISQSTGLNQTQSLASHNPLPINQSQSPQNLYQGSVHADSNEGNFKKNRTSTQTTTPTSSNNSISQMPAQNMTFNSGNFISSNNSNPQQPSINTSLNNSQGSSNSGSKISQQHKTIIQGVKLSMQVIESRIPNYSGYAHLILSRNIAYLQNLTQRPFRKQILEILDRQLKDIKSQRDFFASKMFTYQLKGLDDWKKYLRGKFFEDQKTIVLWYRMVNFLSGTGSYHINLNLNYRQMTQNVKNILY